MATGKTVPSIQGKYALARKHGRVCPRFRGIGQHCPRRTTLPALKVPSQAASGLGSNLILFPGRSRRLTREGLIPSSIPSARDYRHGHGPFEDVGEEQDDRPHQ